MSTRIWQDAADQIEAVKPGIFAIQRLGPEEAASLARAAIDQHHADRRYWDLELLRLLDWRIIPHLVDDLVGLRQFEKHAGQVQDLLFRMSRDDLERLVPPAVIRRFDRADAWELLQLAGLLKTLCLPDALRDLLALTATSGDEEIRAIGPDYFPEIAV